MQKYQSVDSNKYAIHVHVHSPSIKFFIYKYIQGIQKEWDRPMISKSTHFPRKKWPEEKL